MKNKGFSLVAIMAILAAAIAPALIRYIDKSRRSDDVAAAETLNTATQAAFSNEDAYDEVQGRFPSTASGETALASASEGGTFAMIGASAPTFINEVNSSCGNKAPSFKYKKNGANKWVIGANGAGKPVVWVSGSKVKGGASGSVELQPSIDKSYK